MTPEEMRRVLLTSEHTDLPNQRAFDEGPQSNFVAMLDLNGLKSLNDHHGYEAGDILLRRLAETLVSVGLDAYHDKGDEFFCKGESLAELNTKLTKAQQVLRNQPFAVQSIQNGRITSIEGGDFCFGIGHNTVEAEQSLKHQKEMKKFLNQE